MRIKGKIEQIKRSETNKQSFSILVNGEWYGLYEESEICRFNLGEYIDEEYTQKGKFKNLKLRKEPVDVDDTEERKKFNVVDIQPSRAETNYIAREDEKIRSMSVAYAKDVAVAMIGLKIAEGDVTEAIIETAKKFYEYIKNG